MDNNGKELFFFLFWFNEKSILCNFIHLSNRYLLLFVISRAKNGISKIAEFQFTFLPS